MTKAMSALGANPIGMPVSKLTISLQKKVIDGMLTPWSAVKDFRLFDLVKHIAEVEMYTMPMAVVMNKGKWNSLPDYAHGTHVLHPGGEPHDVHKQDRGFGFPVGH